MFQPSLPIEQEQALAASVPDLLNEAQLLQWAGVSLGKEELYFLSLSMKELVKQQPTITELRFFGKIFGSTRDYYVAESKLKQYPKMGKFC